MIEKWAVAHKVGIEQAKQMLLTKAGVGRYGNRRISPSSWPFWFLRWMTGTQLRIDRGDVKSA